MTCRREKRQAGKIQHTVKLPFESKHRDSIKRIFPVPHLAFISFSHLSSTMEDEVAAVS
jgi:hypothetical protein